MTAAPSKPLWRAVDTLDDRREVFQLLNRLPPRLRVRWLKWCCQQCTLPGSASHPTVPPTTTGENPMEIFMDFWSLTNEWRLQPLVGMNALVQVVHHYEKGHFRRGSTSYVHLPK